ncbi:MAG: MlaD family protein, partial [Actinomycetota bacterium]
MKSFRDRNPYAVGLVSVAIIGVLTALAFAIGLLHLLEDTYTMSGVFPDASGIRSGDQVRVAGVKVGRVTGIEADREHGNVIVTWVVNSGVELGPETTAEIALETLLGAKYLHLDGPVAEPFIEDLPEERRRIPLERTTTPFDIFELTRIGTRSIQATDTEKLNQFINDLADITEGKNTQLRDLVVGIDRVATAINQRDTQLDQLLDRADDLSAMLADKDETLVRLIDASRD